MKRMLGSMILFAVGCGPSYDRTEIDSVSQSDLPGIVNPVEIRVPIGGVTTARVAPYNTDDDEMGGNVVSQDASVLEVDRTTAANVYAFLGVRVGTTRVILYADGAAVGAITATVVDQ
jgi:hypothetical protein